MKGWTRRTKVEEMRPIDCRGPRDEDRSQQNTPDGQSKARKRTVHRRQGNLCASESLCPTLLPLRPSTHPPLPSLCDRPFLFFPNPRPPIPLPFPLFPLLILHRPSLVYRQARSPAPSDPLQKPLQISLPKQHSPRRKSYRRQVRQRHIPRSNFRKGQDVGERLRPTQSVKQRSVRLAFAGIYVDPTSFRRAPVLRRTIKSPAPNRKLSVRLRLASKEPD